MLFIIAGLITLIVGIAVAYDRRRGSNADVNLTGYPANPGKDTALALRTGYTDQSSSGAL